MLDGLQGLAVLILLEDDLGTAHGKLEAFAAHGLDEDGHLELAAALDQEGVLVGGVFHAHGHVAQAFAVQAVADHAALHQLAFTAGQGRGVDAEAHGHGGLVHADARQGAGVLAGADGVADGHVLDAGHHHDVAGLGLVHFGQLQAFIDLDLGGAQGAGLTVFTDAGQALVGVDAAVHDAAHGQTAQVIGVVQVGHQHLEGLLGIVGRTGDLFEDGLEQGGQVLLLVVDVAHGHTGAADGVEHGEFQLLVAGVQIDEQVVDLVEHFIGTGVLAVDLVDDHDHGQTGFQGLAQYEAGLGQRAFGGVHQQDGAAGHGERTFHFTAKVGVTGGVDDVDLHAVPVHGAVLGRDGDAAFAFQIHAVHDAVIDLLVCSKHAALTEKGVHQGRFAVVNVGDDSHVTKFVILLHSSVSLW